MKIIFFIIFSFETQGAVWANDVAKIYSNLGWLYDYWIQYNCIAHWQNKNNLYGPADVQIISASNPGVGVVEVFFYPMPPETLGNDTVIIVWGRTSMTIQASPPCQWFKDGYIQVKDTTIWNNGFFSSVMRHEIGHAAGLADESDDSNAIMYPYIPYNQQLKL